MICRHSLARKLYAVIKRHTNVLMADGSGASSMPITRSQAVRCGVVTGRLPSRIMCSGDVTRLNTRMRRPAEVERKCEVEITSMVLGKSGPPSHTQAAVSAHATVPNGATVETIIARPYSVLACSFQ